MPASSAALAPAERLARLRLARSEHVGPVTFKKLVERFGSAVKALEALPELARRGGLARRIKVADLAEIETETKRLEALGGRHLLLGEADYPQALAATEDPPPVLSLLGRAELLERATVGIVGARNASANGRGLAERLARDLAQRGLLVASGLARGIDAAAHRGALADGTVAALAGGVDTVYPEENRALQEAIAEQGLLLSEWPPGLEPRARHFPRRNRIISGLSLGVVVVEAALRSGSLITARLAGEQGREVMAVPGSPLDPRARGCNALLKTGATLIENAEEVIAALPLAPSGRPRLAEQPQSWQPETLPDAPREAPEAGRARLIELLGPTPLAVDEAARRCQLSAPEVALLLLELELAGRIERHRGNRVSLRASGDGGPS